MKRLWFEVLVTSLGAGTVFAQGKEAERLAHSAKVFGEIMEGLTGPAGIAVDFSGRLC